MIALDVRQYFLNLDRIVQVVKLSLEGVSRNDITSFFGAVGGQSIDQSRPVHHGSLTLFLLRQEVVVDNLASLITIHDGHVDIKDDSVEIVRWLRTDDLHSLQAVLSRRDNEKLLKLILIATE